MLRSFFNAYSRLQTNFSNKLASKDPGVRGTADEIFTALEYEFLLINPESLGADPQTAKAIVENIGTHRTALTNKANDFFTTHDIGADHLNKVNEIARKIEAGKATPDEIKLVVAAKEFWKDLQMNEGSYLHLESFASYNPKLIAIKQLSRLNSKEVDTALFNHLEEKHKKNNPGDIPTVIVGAGPTGLMAAFKLFEVGRSVKVYEARSNNYSRTQILTLDPKLTAQMQYYLGSEYDSLINQGALKLRADGVTEVITKDFEAALSRHFSNLITHVKNDPSITSPELHYNSPVQSVKKEGGKQNLVIKNSSEGERLVPYQHLVLAGGAGQKVIQGLHLGPTVKQTQKKGYGVAVVKQNKPVASTNLPFSGKIYPREMPKALERAEEELNQINDKDKERLAEPWKALKEGFIGKQIEYRHFENKQQRYMGFELPKEAISFQKELKKIKSEYDIQIKRERDSNKKEHLEKSLEQIKSFENHLQTVISATLMKELGIQADESNLIYKAFFPVAQQVVRENLKIQGSIESGYTVVSMIGDAGASPHFFSGSGQSSARKWEDDLAAFTLNWNKDPNNFNIHASKLKQANQETINFTLKRGENYIGPLADQEIQKKERKAITKTLQAIDRVSNISHRSTPLLSSSKKEFSGNNLEDLSFQLEFDYRTSTRNQHVSLERGQDFYALKIENQKNLYFNSFADVLDHLSRLN